MLLLLLLLLLVLFWRPVTGWNVLVLVDVVPWRGLGARSSVGWVVGLLLEPVLPELVDVPVVVVLRRCCEPNVPVVVVVFFPALLSISLSPCPWSLGRC